MFPRLLPIGCLLACLLLTGCASDPSASITGEILSRWNEYADLCLQIKDEKSARYYVVNKLNALEDKWKAAKPRYLEFPRQLRTKKEKQDYFDMLNKEPWSREGKATTDRLIHAVNRLNEIIVKEEKKVRDERAAAGDATPVNRNEVCKNLIEAVKFRERFYFDFAVAFPSDSKLTWGFPKGKEQN